MNRKIFDVIIDFTAHEKLLFWIKKFFLWNQNDKFSQMLVQLVANISEKCQFSAIY